MSKELEEWLNNLNNPKLGSRIIFGKDISKMMVNKMLKTLYCTKEFSDKVKLKVPKDLQIFDFVVINSYETGDTGYKLNKNYAGAVGITFY